MENPLNYIEWNGVKPGREAVYLLINSAFVIVLRACKGVSVGASRGSEGTQTWKDIGISRI
jgi:hypothetical protein